MEGKLACHEAPYFGCERRRFRSMKARVALAVARTRRAEGGVVRAALHSGEQHPQMGIAQGKGLVDRETGERKGPKQGVLHDSSA